MSLLFSFLACLLSFTPKKVFPVPLSQYHTILGIKRTIFKGINPKKLPPKPLNAHEKSCKQNYNP